MIAAIWNHQKFGSFVRYGCTSGLSFVVTFGTAFLAHDVVGLPSSTAGGIALLIALCLNFFMTRLVVFRKSGAWGRSAVRFLLVSVAFRAAEYFGYLLLLENLRLHYLVALLVVTLTSQVLKYVTYRAFVFS